MPLHALLSPLRRAGVAAIGILHFLSLSQPALAATRSWNNAAGGAANVAGNWSPAFVPGSADLAEFGPATPNAAYNVSWASPADTLSALDTFIGEPRFNISTVLGVQGQMLVKSESLTVLTGILRAGHMLVGSGGTGHMMVTGSSTQLVLADSLFGSILGDQGLGNLWVQGGGKVYSNSFIKLAFTHTDQCTTTSIAGSLFLHYFSGIQTLAAGAGSRGDIVVGDSGSAVLQAVNGGYITAAGDLFVGMDSLGVGFVHVYNWPTGIGSPALTVDGQTYISANTSGPTSCPGTGSLLEERGFVTLNGTTHIGGGKTPGNLTVRNGAQLTTADVQIAAPNTVTNSALYVIGSGTQATLNGTLLDGLNSPSPFGTGKVSVDSAGLLTYNGAGPLTVSRDGFLEVKNGATLTSSVSEMDVSGLVNNSSLIQAPLVRTMDNYGVLPIINVAGTIQARMLIADSTQLSTFKPAGVPIKATVGDSTATDGFVSHGQTTVLDDTLVILDKDGAQLGSMSMGTGSSPGTLILPSGGFTVSGDSIYAQGVVHGNLDNGGKLVVQASKTLAFYDHLSELSGQMPGTGQVHIESTGEFTGRGAVTNNLLLDGKLDLGLAPGTLRLGGTCQMAPGSKTTLHFGSRASGIQDSLVVAGLATLGGTLDLRSIAGNPAAVGDTLTLIVAGSFPGGSQFSAVTIDGQQPVTPWVKVLYGTTTVKVVVLKAIAAVDPGAGGTPAAKVLRFAAAGTLADPSFSLDLPQAAVVRVSAYDVSGRRLQVLHDGPLDAGSYRFHLAAGSESSNGVFFARAEIQAAAGRRVLTARAVRVR